ncbi:hypothetical protein, partial [Pseudomonas aeruginosa]|uniref:hypothetical protein n=1 Tax=Pseudomonas aeruginosa TaxID=287 RepID=UPI003978EDB0
AGLRQWESGFGFVVAARQHRSFRAHPSNLGLRSAFCRSWGSDPPELGLAFAFPDNTALN